jgi:hypothetical protein
MAILIVAVAIGSFFGGTKYQQRKNVSNFRQQMISGNNLPQGMGRNAINNDSIKSRGQAAGFRQTIGEIISIDDKTITVKLADGGSKIVLISETTKINQSVAATKTDLKIGTKIMVNGETNTDGSITSRNIEINPAVVTLTATPTVKQ